VLCAQSVYFYLIKYSFLEECAQSIFCDCAARSV
jgi:hypothetical protein